MWIEARIDPRRVIRLWTKSSAPAIRSNETATCAATSALCSEMRRPPTKIASPSALSAVTRFNRLAWSAGANPKIMPVPSAMTVTNVSTRTSGERSSDTVTGKGNCSCESARVAQKARSTPPAPPSARAEGSR
jgi:hypothetical protein